MGIMIDNRPLNRKFDKSKKSNKETMFHFLYFEKEGELSVL